MDPEIGDGAISNCEGIGSQMGERGGGGGLLQGAARIPHPFPYIYNMRLYLIPLPCPCIRFQRILARRHGVRTDDATY